MIFLIAAAIPRLSTIFPEIGDQFTTFMKNMVDCIKSSLTANTKVSVKL